MANEMVLVSGHDRKAIMNIAGTTFGRITVLSEISTRDANGAVRRMVAYRCACGNIGATRKGSLFGGVSKSCGCWNHDCPKEGNWRHGMRHTPLYEVWKCMRQRCYDSNCSGWLRYGGRGILVCDRWMSFPAFYEDMGDIPFEGASIERIDNDANYEKGNCRWATRIEQANNKRNNRALSLWGVTRNLSEWSRIVEIKRETIAMRLRSGWSIEKALLAEVR